MTVPSGFPMFDYDLDDVCLSVPAIVSQNGVERIIGNKLPAAEQKALEKSAALLKRSVADLEKSTPDLT